MDWIADSDDLIQTERAWLLADRLFNQRQRLTRRQIAEIAGITPDAAHRHMVKASRVVAVAQDDDGSWYYVAPKNELDAIRSGL